MRLFSEENIFIFLTQIFLLLGLARLLGELFRRFKQPSLTAEILVGIFLGPTILGRFAPSLHRSLFPFDATQQTMLETVAWLGLLFFLLETGLKMDFSSAWRHRGAALTIALTGIVVPMVISFAACFSMPSLFLAEPAQDVMLALFLATVMTISAMPIAIRALNDLDMTKTDLGFLIMSALSVNEIIGWVLVTFILRLLMPSGVSVAHVLTGFISVIGLIVVFLSVGRRFADYVMVKIKTLGLPEPATSLTFICLLGMFCGALFQRLGIHALIGFFIAGIMAGEARALPERTRQVISQMVYAIFIPLFFTGIGLKVDFLASFNFLLVFFVSAVGILGKFTGAWIGSKIARISHDDRLPVAIAHTPGGSMEIVVGLLALQYHLITPELFVAIVVGALVSSSLLGPWLKYAVERRERIGILEFFSRSNVIADMHATARDGAIRELCGLVSEGHNIPNLDSLCSAVLNRENIMGTAIEEGLAVPHARFASLAKPMIAFGRSAAGIDWNSPDGNPTHFIFLILTPKGNDWAQLQILRIIAKTMNNLAIRQGITKAATAQELWDTLEKVFTEHRIIRKR